MSSSRKRQKDMDDSDMSDDDYGDERGFSGGITKSGRVRRRPAKLLDMADPDEIDKMQLTRKPPPQGKLIVHPSKKSAKAEPIQLIQPLQTAQQQIRQLQTEQPTMIRLTQQMRPPSSSQQATMMTADEIKIEPEQSLKLKFHLGETPSVESVQRVIKRVKPPATTTASGGATSHHDVKPFVVPQSMASSSQISLTPMKETKRPSAKKSDVMGSSLAQALLQPIPSATTAPSSPPAKKVAKLSQDAQMTSQGPVYADTDVKALKLKTSREKRGLKNKRKKSPDGDEESTGKKKKRGPSAYMLFCKLHRDFILRVTPNLDFSQISRQLGERWQVLPKKKKVPTATLR